MSAASSPHIPDEKITGVNLTQTTVTELVPFLTYTFSVTAENAVSSQDSNVIARTTSTTATTLEGGEFTVLVLEYCQLDTLHRI